MFTFIAQLIYIGLYTAITCFAGQTCLGLLGVNLTGWLWFGTALLTGMGALAGQLGLFSLVGIPFNGILLYGPWLAWLIVRLAVRFKAGKPFLPAGVTFNLQKRWERAGRAVWLTRLLAFGCIFVVFALLTRQLLTPLLGTDGTTIWFSKARAFYLIGKISLDNLEPSLAHLDYPVAFPLIICTVYLMGGGFLEQLGLAVPGLFMLACLALLYSYSRRSLAPWRSLCLILTFLALPAFLTLVNYLEALSQADFAVGVTFLLFGVFYTLWIEDEKPGYLAVSLLAATFGASVKNEGLSFLGLAVLASGLTLLIKPGLRLGVFKGKRLAIALVLMVATVGGWKIFTDLHHYQNDVMSNFSFNKLLTNIPTEYPTVLQRFWDVVLNDVSYWFLGIMLVFSLVVALSARNKHSIAIIGLILVIFGQILAYMLTYFISPFHLVWTNDTTFYRLMGQLVPLGFFIFYIGVSKNSRELAAQASPALEGKV